MTEAARKILIVDDLWDDRFFLIRTLRKTNLPVTIFETEDGDGAIDFLSHAGRFAEPGSSPTPEVMFLDLKMPGKNGFDVLRWIREHPPEQPMRVVVLSGSEAQQDIQRAFQEGAHEYLIKPAKVEDLQKALADGPPVNQEAPNKTTGH